MTHEVTIEDIHAGLREELEMFGASVLAYAVDVSQFQRKGGISTITAADLFSLGMDDALSDIEEDPANSGPSIEQLATLYLARMVAARIASGAVLGSRSAAMKENPSKEKPKKARTKKAAKDAQELATAPVPAVAETEIVSETEPESDPITEVLESNQAFLAQSDEPTVDPAIETVPSEPIELTKADNGVLDLL